MADMTKTGAAKMTEAQKAYETKRAAKAGKSLDAWLSDKEKRQAAVAAPVAGKAALKKPGFFGRLLDRAHKPL